MAPQTQESTVPDSYANLDELADPEPVENPGTKTIRRADDDLEHKRTRESRRGKKTNARFGSGEHEDKSDEYANLDEIVGPSPIENPDEHQFYEHHELEEERTKEQTFEDLENHERQSSHVSEKSTKNTGGKYLTQLYVTSYLILFAILGTLARLGVTALTIYPGAPVITTELWANVGGCFVMGWLSEDRFLFRKEWTAAQEKTKATGSGDDSSSESSEPDEEAIFAAAKKEHDTSKKTVPLYIGLAVGFCGSFTSFSSFIRDIFLALDNGLNSLTYNAEGMEVNEIYPRNAGYSVISVIAVVLIEVTLAICALNVGAHFAISIEPVVTRLPTTNLRRFIDPAIVPIAWGAWIGAIVMAIFPPDCPGGPAANGRTSWAQESWRGQVLFALVFAPVGCLLRFHLSLRLNGKIASFPLGTFVANIFGTVILGMSWDLQRAPLGMGAVGGGRIGCQVLQGIEDGFCGCLTTVSTWALELKGLQRKHAYVYGGASVGIGLSFLVVIMGSLVWTIGASPLACVTT